MTPREPDRFDAQALDLVEDLDVAMGSACGHTHISHHNPKVREKAIGMVAGALRTEHASALERAAQEYGGDDLSDVKVYCRHVAQRLREIARALIPPAAPPAAEDDTPRCNTFGAMGLPSIAPAAETGKAAITYVNAEQWAAAGQQPLDDKKPREPGCQCHQEEGDSPCPVHGEEPGKAQEALDELAAVLRGKDEMGEKLAKALGVPAGPLGRLVDEAIARIALIRECEAFVRWMIRAEGSKWDEARSDALLAKLAARAAPPEREGK